MQQFVIDKVVSCNTYFNGNISIISGAIGIYWNKHWMLVKQVHFQWLSIGELNNLNSPSKPKHSNNYLHVGTVIN